MDSFKKNLIFTFQALPNVEGLENNRLIIFTAAGTFLGTPVYKETEKDNESVKIMNSFVYGAAEDYRKENNLPADQPLDGDDGCIILSDVTLITGGSQYSIPVATIFFDQVIGISWGDID